MLSNTSTKSKKGFDISSATLHIIAMATMLIDHLMKSAIESDSSIIVLGRLAFPIFAFMTAQGFAYTHNYRRYMLRMLLFALLAEVPYDLMKSHTPFDMYDQNVIWTFIIALLCMGVIEYVKKKGKVWAYVLTSIVMTIVGILLGTVFMVDYGGMGVATVLVFYFLPQRTWWARALQLVLMYIINAHLLGAFGYGATNISLFGMDLELTEQAFAVFALIPIWLYHGRQGYHSKPFQYFCYAFYPAHMLIMYFLDVGI